VLSRMLYGAAVSLLVGFAACSSAASSAPPSDPGRVPRRLDGHGGDDGGRRQLAFPFVLLAIGIIGVLGPAPDAVV